MTTLQKIYNCMINVMLQYSAVVLMPHLHLHVLHTYSFNVSQKADFLVILPFEGNLWIRGDMLFY